MKKIFSFIVGLVIVTSLQAVNYKDAARITMSCSGGPETQQLDLIVDADQATPATEPNLASLYEVGQVNLYAKYNNGNYSSFTANAISNLPVVVVTNRRDASYTFTFNVPVTTEGLVLTDLRSSKGVKNIDIVHGESYTFSVANETNYAANTNVTIADRFVINYVAPATSYNVTLNDEYLATFSAAENVVIPAGLKAYQAEYVSMSEVLALSPIASYIPANTGVILYNEAKDNKNFALDIYTGTDAMPTIDANDLKPATEWENHTGTIYILHGSELWEYTGADFVTNKAYLELPVSVPAPKRIRLVFNQATDIDNVEAGVKAEKFIENGQIFIRRGNEVFNLQGQNIK